MSQVIDKGIEAHSFTSADVHTLMDLVCAQIKTIQDDPELAGYVDYLHTLRKKVVALWIELLPGQEALYTIREQQE